MAFAVGSGGLNSGPLACEGSILAELSLDTLECTFLTMDPDWKQLSFPDWGEWVMGSLEAWQ